MLGIKIQSFKQNLAEDFSVLEPQFVYFHFPRDKYILHL